MLETSWEDWAGEAEAALARLQARLPEGGRVVVAGLSMGGALTLHLATRHPELAGIVCINAVGETPADMRPAIEEAVEGGIDVFPGIGSDIADPDAKETSYEGTPLKPLLSLFDGVEAFQEGLGSITCPVLVMTSPQDHVVPPVSSDHIAVCGGRPRGAGDARAQLPRGHPRLRQGPHHRADPGVRRQGHRRLITSRR